MDKISIIVPCYNEEESLPLFYKETGKELEKIEGTDYEFVFVDDGSRDRTLEILRALSAKDEHCRFVSFSRNFGKEAAMFAGLEHAEGDYCVIMDADLQHPPSLLSPMYEAVSREGYDCCAGFRQDREGEGHLRNFLSKSFYKVMQKLCRFNMSDGAGDFRMMSRVMVNSILNMKEYNRYMKGIFSFVGFDTKWIPFHNVERAAGESKWSLKSLFSYAMEGMFSFSTRPAAMAGTVSALLIILSAVLTVSFVCAGLISGHGISSTGLIVSLILFMSGLQMFFIYILGQYVTKDYMENKKRPIYIVKEGSGLSHEKM